MLYGVIVMRETGGIIRLCVCAICCAATLIYNTYGYFFTVKENASFYDTKYKTQIKSNYTVLSGVNITAKAEQTTTSAPVESTGESETVAVSSGGEVKGKIHISLYRKRLI